MPLRNTVALCVGIIAPIFFIPTRSVFWARAVFLQFFPLSRAPLEGATYAVCILCSVGQERLWWRQMFMAV